MLIGIIDNDVVTQVAHYKSIFSEILFSSSGPSDDFLAANNAKRVNTSLPFNSLTQKLVPATPYVDGDWIYTVRVEDLSAEEIEGFKQSQWAKVRIQRNRMLSDSDWTQIPDAPDTDKTEWATYRQALRDITTQDDPYNLTWPLAPGQEPPPEPAEEPAPAPETTTVVTTESEPEPVPVDSSTVTSTSTES